MRALMLVGAIIALLVGIMGFASSRTDIQLIIGFVGLFSFLIMLGLGSVMKRLDER